MANNFGGHPPGQMVDDELERQLAEEFRRRQLAAGQYGGLSGGYPQQQPQIMEPSYYVRSPNYGYQHQSSLNSTEAAMYAAQRRQQQSYGYAPQGYPYAMGYPPYGGPIPPQQTSQSSGEDPYQVLKTSSSGFPVGSSSLKPSPVQGNEKQDEEIALMAASTKPRINKPKSFTLPEERPKQPRPPARITVRDGTTIIEDGENEWYTGCVPLGLEDDKYWLSELQVYLRSNFAEAFGATEEDIAAPMHGRNKPIALGQVGIRCMHCKNDNPAERGQQATSYPSLISGIYNSVQQMLRLHLDCCLSMPPEVRAKIEQLKLSCSSRGGRKQYWIDSAKRLGLVDTPHGIHFGRDPHGPLPPLSGPSVNTKEGRIKKAPSIKAKPAPRKEIEPEPEPLPPPPPVDSRPLVYPEDKPLISDYLYLTLEQMAPCTLMEADRVGCYKTRKLGFPGLACRHCVGQAGCGRYFPASEASLSQTTTSQTIMNHVRNCRRCPIEIRENLEIMKRQRMGPDGKRSDKPKHGGRKVFFHRLWCRIQDLPIEEGDELKTRKKKTKSPSKRKKKGNDSDQESEGVDENESSEESESEEESETEDDSLQKTRRRSVEYAGSKMKISPWFEGCVRLTKADDSQHLSGMDCYARSDLIEVFSLKKKDFLNGYNGRKDPSPGQVGIRCIFCKSLDPSERANGCLAFPESLSAIHTKVADMVRLHFPSCPGMPDSFREKFKMFRGYDAKVASDDSQQYWIDSARDIGLSDIPPDPSKKGAWGITFRRDPLQPSPADELDLEMANETPFDLGKNSLIREEDRGECTDQVMLLMRQVRPCQFNNNDRRAGSGTRGRDRALDFPGLCCVHCSSRNSSGRYFPMNSKNLTDSTINSLASHVSSCSSCPEPIKASLAYLSHRSIRQKGELSGSWKKSFFKKIWDRLHVEREWTEAYDEPQVGDEDDDEAGGKDDEYDEEEEEEEEEEGEDGSGSEEEDEEQGGENMNALIKAAAIWLTKSDNADSKGKKSKRAAASGLSGAPLQSSKRRRGGV